MLASVKEIINSASKGGYGVGAFCCANMEMIQAIIDAAEIESSPVIIQFNRRQIHFGGLNCLYKVVEVVANETKIPVGVSLDHGVTFEQAMMCVRTGFTGILYDLSELSLKENINQIRKLKEVCSFSSDIAIGAAIGHMDIGKVQEMANIEQVSKLVKETNVDLVAPAVGSVHGSKRGQWKSRPNLNFELIKKISETVQIPLSIHGGSGIPSEDIKKLVENGVRKLVIYTDTCKAYKEAFINTLKKEKDNGDLYTDILYFLRPARKEVTEMARRKIRALGSQGKAVEFKVAIKKTPGYFAE